MLSKLKKNKKGFTLVELIVVIAIIAVLAAIAVPTTMHFVNQANDEKAQKEAAGAAKIAADAITAEVTKGSIKNFDEVLAIINQKDVMPSTEYVSTITLKFDDATNVLSVNVVSDERGQDAKADVIASEDFKAVLQGETDIYTALTSEEGLGLEIKDGATTWSRK